MDSPGSTTPSTTQADLAAAVEAATRFMRTEVGMADPVAGQPTPTGPDTVDVPVSPGPPDQAADGSPRPPVTVVSLTRSPDGWTVTGARTEQIVVDSPRPGEAVARALTVRGRASAFEGTVQVRVRGDGGRDPVGEGVVQGSGTLELGPFESRVDCDGATPGSGWVIFLVSSEADGQVIQATAVPVRLTG